MELETSETTRHQIQLVSRIDNSLCLNEVPFSDHLM